MFSNSGKTIRFIFVLSHTGISGNEEADRAAKEAVESETAEEILFVPSPDAKILFKQVVIQKWQTDWTSPPTALQHINPVVNCLLPLPPDRSDQVVLTRLRLGHTRLTHGYVLNRTPPPPTSWLLASIADAIKLSRFSYAIMRLSPGKPNATISKYHPTSSKL
ncbi:hypothetical protein Zmor_014510 [Zophobas morio]|uniref:RNase H type-1 domain-containing protein n=1 Tax=Zophobas morio TaxID=2755281 RepID=A0AA38IK37_9CUCU|nr:hypothetical protein Zmor_014510 [Zophobas morio]